MIHRTAAALTVSLFAVFLASCSDDANPLAPFEPEIVSGESFQFQITAADDVSVTETYAWSNPMTRASVDHSTALADGSATVVVLDADGVEVYRSDLMASGNEATAVGVAGDWTVRVHFSDFDGSANFRLEKL